MAKHTQLTPAQKKEIENKLKASANFAEFLDILKQEYDLKNCKPSPMIKAMITPHIMGSLFNTLNPEKT